MGFEVHKSTEIYWRSVITGRNLFHTTRVYLSQTHPSDAMPRPFFKNYRVYLLTSVAYMGSLLFGVQSPLPLTLDHETNSAQKGTIQV